MLDPARPDDACWLAKVHHFPLPVCFLVFDQKSDFLFVVGDSLYEVMLKLISQKVHRMWVVNASNVVIGVVSFSDIFSQLKIHQKKN